MSQLMHGKVSGSVAGDGRLPVSLNPQGEMIVMIGTPAFVNFAATTAPAALPDLPCRHVEIKNVTGVNVVVDHGPGTATFTVPTGNDKVFHCQASASELRVSVSAGACEIDMEVWG